MNMKNLGLLMVVLAGAQLAAAEGVLKLEPSPLEMPTRIGPLSTTGEPHKYDEPGLGVSWQYNAAGLSLTVYVYDADIKDLADGADTVPICREFEIAKRGIAQSYQKVELKSQRLVRVGEGAEAPRVREAVFEFEREQRPQISYVWITSAAGKFLKLRFSADVRLRDEVPEARSALLTAVAAAVQPHLKPADPNAKKPSTSLAVNLSGGADADMTAGLMYLGILSALADKSPELAPVCGGELVPSFDVEVSAWRDTFQMDGSKPKSTFGKLVVAADSAGFLEELVWVDLHRQDWGTQPPEGLDLEGYAPWRKKHMKRFQRPDFGRIVVEYPRPLPEEPL
jgi:hypothetical protein